MEYLARPIGVYFCFSKLINYNYKKLIYPRDERHPHGDYFCIELLEIVGITEYRPTSLTNRPTGQYSSILLAIIPCILRWLSAVLCDLC